IGQSVREKLTQVLTDKTLISGYTESLSETERTILSDAVEHVIMRHVNRTEKSLTEQLYSLTETEQEAFFSHMAVKLLDFMEMQTHTQIAHQLHCVLQKESQTVQRLTAVWNEKINAIKMRRSIRSSIYHFKEINENESTKQGRTQYSESIPVRFVHLRKRMENIVTELHETTSQTSYIGNIRYPDTESPVRQMPHSSLHYAASSPSVSDEVAEQLESLSQQVYLQKQRLSQIAQQKQERRPPALTSMDMERIAEEVMQYMDRKSHTIRRKNGIF
ncbi:MAG: hypothetical protein IJ512_02065, partial [Ruminococcus sp.]|nr:hypothetical protein [Ruminococcus sp.]